MKKTILIIEDNKTNRVLLENILNCSDFCLYFAYDAAEGFNLINEISPDLIITDIELGEMNGIEFAKKVKNQNFEKKRNIPIIAITAHSEDSFSERDKLLFDSIVFKPINIENFLSEVKKLIYK